jgi:hypothetical protein
MAAIRPARAAVTGRSRDEHERLRDADMRAIETAAPAPLAEAA